jgi:hypothetical protein
MALHYSNEQELKRYCSQEFLQFQRMNERVVDLQALFDVINVNPAIGKSHESRPEHVRDTLFGSARFGIDKQFCDKLLVTYRPVSSRLCHGILAKWFPNSKNSIQNLSVCFQRRLLFDRWRTLLMHCLRSFVGSRL